MTSIVICSSCWHSDECAFCERYVFALHTTNATFPCRKHAHCDDDTLYTHVVVKTTYTTWNFYFSLHCALRESIVLSSRAQSDSHLGPICKGERNRERVRELHTQLTRHRDDAVNNTVLNGDTKNSPLYCNNVAATWPCWSSLNCALVNVVSRMLIKLLDLFSGVERRELCKIFSFKLQRLDWVFKSHVNFQNVICLFLWEQ